MFENGGQLDTILNANVPNLDASRRHLEKKREIDYIYSISIVAEKQGFDKGMAMILPMRILTAIKGTFVGQDCFGNRYFEERFLFSRPRRHPRRWVDYKGRPDGSAVPPEWFGWLHFAYERPLTKTARHPWQKTYIPNQTGTDQAYRPHAYNENPDSCTSKDYESWRPV